MDRIVQRHAVTVMVVHHVMLLMELVPQDVHRVGLVEPAVSVSTASALHKRNILTRVVAIHVSDLRNFKL